MADKSKKPSTRKPAHTIPLTHRQQRAKKRPQSEQTATQSVSMPHAAIPRKQTTRAQAPATQTPRRASRVSTLQPKPAVAEAITEPAVEEVAEPAIELAVESAPDEPRRVRVRVRRKSIPLLEAMQIDITRQEASQIDITRQDTTILPTMRIFPPQPRQPDSAPDAISAETLAEEAPATLHAETLTEPVAPAPDSSELALEPLVVAEPEPELAHDEPEPAAAIEEPDAEELESLASDDEAVAEDEEPEQPERRRMPTLAVMVALAPRAEPAPTTPLLEEEFAENSEVSAEALPDAPIAEETVSAPDFAVPTDAVPTEAEDVVAEPATEPTVEMPDETPTIEPTVEMSDETPTVEMSDEATAAEPANEQSEDAPAQPPRLWMWWAQRPRRQAAPETRPIAAMESALSAAASVAPVISQDAEQTAPRRVARRTEAATTAATPAPAESRAAKTVAKRADAEVEALAERRRAARERQRNEEKNSTRAVVLSWAAFGYAVVASIAALVAVIAGLRFSTGGAAQAIFVWALALALIAGLGAWLGYLCAQLGRPLLATLALLLSQLGALVWALGLLGPRAALLMLAPASVALALRGAGRLSAMVAGLAWFTLYLADLALNLLGAQHPHLILGLAGAALVDVSLTLVGLWLIVNILISLYTSRLNAVAHGRAVEHVALHTEAQLDRLRAQTEDDAEALRQALLEALRGEQPARVYARGPLSAVAEMVNEMADRLVDLRYDRTERKRLESATRRLTRVIERAWLGLSWSWPDATGTILDDLLALLRTPPPSDTPALPDETSPTGQVVAPHLFRGWRPTEQMQRVSQPGAEQEVLPGMPSVPSQPSAPSLPSLLEGDTSMRLTTPLELPPSPRWRGSSSRHSASDQSGAPDR